MVWPLIISVYSMVWKLDRSHCTCILLLSEFMLICARWLLSLCFHTLILITFRTFNIHTFNSFWEWSLILHNMPISLLESNEKESEFCNASSNTFSFRNGALTSAYMPIWYSRTLFFREQKKTVNLPAEIPTKILLNLRKLKICCKRLNDQN